MLVLNHKKYANDGQFHHFWRQLFHTSLTRILESLKDFMKYIRDYPKQVLLTNIIQ